MSAKITEIIPGNMPDWAVKAMGEGQLFNETLRRIKELEKSQSIWQQQGNVIQLKPCSKASTALRNIANQMDRGEITATECTVIAGTDVFHCGDSDDARSAESAIFNMTMGIQKLMRPVIDAGVE